MEAIEHGEFLARRMAESVLERRPPPTGAIHELSERLLQEELRASLFGQDQRPVFLDQYRIREVIGKGGMGVVYRAFDPDLDRDVAIKLIAPQGGEFIESRRERLFREGSVLFELEHVGIVPVYDIGTINGQVYLVLEYIDGVDVRTWIKQTSPSWEAIVDCFVVVARALAFVHDRGLVHRDVKPGNVMIERHEGRVRVLDFGLVGEPKDHDLPRRFSTLTATGVVVGTPRYMSPEHVQGTPSFASDQFSLCVSLYEALFGEHPYEQPARDLVDLTSRARPWVYTPPPAGVVPSAVAAVILRGLSHDPADRFADLHEFTHALLRAARARGDRGVSGALVVAWLLLLLALLGAAALWWLSF